MILMNNTVLAIRKIENITVGRRYKVVVILENMISIIDNQGYKINFFKKEAPVYKVNKSKGLLALEDYFEDIEWLYNQDNIERIII